MPYGVLRSRRSKTIPRIHPPRAELRRATTDDAVVVPSGPSSGRSAAAKAPVLSVVIPVRNELPRLPAVLEGLERQHLQPDEVVIADGGSTDGTREWLEAAARSRSWLRVVDNPGRSV